MPEKIIGVILAGGLARRLGNIDKALVQIGTTNLLDRAITNLENQCDQVLINANGNPDRFHNTNNPIIADTIKGHAGPLAGVLSAMQWVQENAPQTKWIATLPVDTPFAPKNFAHRLLKHTLREKADMACASSGKRHHPVVGLWPVNLANQLKQAMINEDMRKVDLWTARFKLTIVDFKVGQYDPFFNINRPADIETGQEIDATIAKDQSHAS